MKAKDLFSGQAKDYAKYRPHYPSELFDYLASACPDRELAWDCATGNGQAALELAKSFERVIATDLSAAQLASATPHPRIEYHVAPAHESGLLPQSASLITVAQAAHWFDAAAFAREVRRVIKPQGILAVWSYGHSTITPEVDRVMHWYHDDLLGPYWEPERKLVGEGHFEINLPFINEENPAFEMSLEMDLATYLGYLGTWSALKKARAALGYDPLEKLGERMVQAWGDEKTKRTVVWPLTVRLGKIQGD